ncbi:MAG: flavodoxin family protein [Bacillota bacterium]|nr:flavodoxin family protein [Bacillota bacterium]
MKEIKVAAVISSAHFSGNGAELAREVLKGAKSRGADTEEIFLQRRELKYCTGCLKCISGGHCPIQDDFEEIRKLLYAADGIVLCSPTFGGTINAAMKNLFDRLGMFERCTSMLGGKYVIGLSTASNESAAKKTAKELAKGISLGTFKRSMTSGIIGASILPDGIAKNSVCLADAFKMGEKLVDDIITGKKYHTQNIAGRVIMHKIVRPIMYSYIVDNRENTTKAVYENLCDRGLA